MSGKLLEFLSEIAVQSKKIQRLCIQKLNNIRKSLNENRTHKNALIKKRYIFLNRIIIVVMHSKYYFRRNAS